MAVETVAHMLNNTPQAVYREYYQSRDAFHYKDLREGSRDQTSFKLTKRKKSRIWRFSAHSPRIFGHHEHLTVLV